MITTAPLIEKYNVPGPRYTSYPTVPYWDKKGISVADWENTLLRSFEESNSTQGISLYIHLPFCESLCTFCACNKRITKNHSVEGPYIKALLKEWRLYTEKLPQAPLIKDIHFGGGTPTFFAPKHLKHLVDGIFKRAQKAENASFSLEGHPNNTQKAHLKVLYDLGFRRISYGVQDYDPKVQKTINRIQPFAAVKRATEQAREIGFTSVSHDLIFGLPHQNLTNVIDTIDKTAELKPDRISFYSYAHVPWIKGTGQRGYSERDLPKDSEKRKLYEAGRKQLQKVGYHEVGMDHFALKSDGLYQAMHNQSLHRNFMGYTDSKTQLMIGLGVSAIGDSWYSFAQNEKKVNAYYDRLSKNELPIEKGDLLTEEDLVIRRHILNLMCQFKTSWKTDALKFSDIDKIKERLQEMVRDNLILLTDDSITVTDEGKPFIRNICMAFDLKLHRTKPQTQLFSMTV